MRIGHGGASALAPGNTLESFDVAVEVGVDMVEFDVRVFAGEMVLAHTRAHSRLNRTVALAHALAHLRARRFHDVGINVDVKHVGFERALLEQLRDSGLMGRVLLSSQVAEVLDRVRAVDPRVRTGISIGGHVPRLLCHRWGDWRVRVLEGLARDRWDALMAQHRLVDAALVADVAERGAEVYAWTVGERRTLLSLIGLGVHGIATPDPRLFV